MEVLRLDKPATILDLTCTPGTCGMLHRHLRGVPASVILQSHVIQSLLLCLSADCHV